MKELRIIELFGGIGACSTALKRLNINYTIVDYVEIDKYAVKSFNAIHNTNFEPQDICKWDKDLKNIDLIMHGSPCQDFSLAGKQAGGDKDSGTRSSLMYETIRIVEKLKPKYVVWENVKNLLSKTHRHNFDAYLKTMENLGYTNFYQVLNAKNYGIPQNRERIFTVSILNGINYEFPKGKMCNNKIDVIGNYMPSGHDASRIVNENGLAPTVKENHGTVTGVAINFEFPKNQKLELKLKDLLEDEVDEKYYLSDKMMNYCLDLRNSQKGTKWEGRADNDTLNSNIAHTLSVRGAGGNQRAGVSNFIVDNIEDEIKVKDLKLRIKNATKQGYLEAEDGDGCYISNIEKKRGTVQKEMIPTLKTNPDIGVVKKNLKQQLCNELIKENKVKEMDVIRHSYSSSRMQEWETRNVEKNNEVPTLDTRCDCLGVTVNQENSLRIRKLTPKECFRLMGFNDEEFEKAEKVNSNAQLYKQAGNSIVVNVLQAIFKNLLEEG